MRTYSVHIRQWSRERLPPLHRDWKLFRIRGIYHGHYRGMCLYSAPLCPFFFVSAFSVCFVHPIQLCDKSPRTYLPAQPMHLAVAVPGIEEEYPCASRLPTSIIRGSSARCRHGVGIHTTARTQFRAVVAAFYIPTSLFLRFPSFISASGSSAARI